MRDAKRLRRQPAALIAGSEEAVCVTYFIATVKTHGFKLYDFAEEIGLTGAALSKRIHGRTPWTFREAQQACAVLGMSLSEFSGYFPLEA